MFKFKYRVEELSKGAWVKSPKFLGNLKFSQSEKKVIDLIKN